MDYESGELGTLQPYKFMFKGQAAPGHPYHAQKLSAPVGNTVVLEIHFESCLKVSGSHAVPSSSNLSMCRSEKS